MLDQAAGLHARQVLPKARPLVRRLILREQGAQLARGGWSLAQVRKDRHLHERISSSLFDAPAPDLEG
jgi:hypothetical protein